MLQGLAGFMVNMLQAYKDASEIDGGEVKSVKHLDVPRCVLNFLRRVCQDVAFARQPR